MIAKTDLAPGERPGWFIVGELGVAIGTFILMCVMLYLCLPFCQC